MRDSRNGTFGVLALALSVLIKVACLAQFSGATGLVVLIGAHALSRAVLAYPLLAYAPVHADGLGAQAGKPTDNDVWLTIGIGAALAFLLLLGKGFFVAIAGAGRGDRGGLVRRRAGSPSASAAIPATRWARCSRRRRSPSWSSPPSDDRRTDRRKSTWRRRAKNHRSGHALVVGPACAGAQSGRPLLRPVRQGLRRQQRGAVQAPGEAAAQGRGLVLVEPAARAQDRRASRQGRRRVRRGADRSRSRRAVISATGRASPTPRSPRSTATAICSGSAPPELRPPGGESFTDLRERTVRSIERLTDKYRGRDIVATAHGGTIRAALAHAFNMHPEAAVRFEIDNVSITLIEHFEQADPAHAWKRRLHQLHAARDRDRARREQGMKSHSTSSPPSRRPTGTGRAARCGWPPTSASSAASRASARRRSRPPTAQPGEKVLDVGCGTGGDDGGARHGGRRRGPCAGRRHLRAADRGGARAAARQCDLRGRRRDDLSVRSRRRSISSSRASA